MREAVTVVRSVVAGFDPVSCAALKRGKSNVYLLHSRSGNQPVVAKCSTENTISIEHRVMTWLEGAPFPTVLAHGTMKAQESGCAWLVSEYAMGEPFHRRSPAHRRLAGAWMGDLHVWSASVAAPSLPARDTAYYREIVLAACRTLAETLAAAPSLTSQDTLIVGELNEMGLEVLDRWSEVRAILGVLPATLVHAGIAGKNIRIVTGQVSPSVLAFDWEQAGWGCPAADMSMVDLRSYAVHARRGGIVVPDARRVAAAGELLWCFAGIPGERPNLLGSWPNRAIGKLAAYLDRIRAAMLVLDTGRQP